MSEVDVETINDENYGQDLSINERANRLLKLIKLKSPAMGHLLNFYTENSNPDYHTTYQEMLAWSESTNVSRNSFFARLLGISRSSRSLD